MKKPFTIIFEDEYLLVANKTARIVIQPTSKKEKYTLTSLLRRSLNKKVYPCHRLDRDTQGLIIYAKSHKAKEGLISQFSCRKVFKKYYAFSQGNLRQKEGLFKSLILDKYGRKFKEKPKEAETAYRVIKSFKGFDFLEVRPKTGRTNQIRIHLAQASHPLLGEKKYAFRRDFVIKFNKLALVAYFLSFQHPAKKHQIKVEIGIPAYMNEFMQKRR